MGLWPEPKDLTTDHDGASVRVAFGYSPMQWPQPSSSLSQSSSLQKYPEGTPVPVSVSHEQPDSSSSSGAFVLHPDAPLAAGWYALVLKAGAGVMYGTLKQADGSYASRFRVGSDPLLTGVGACASKTNTELPKVRLDFSEMVALPSGGPPIQVMVDGKPASCVVYDPPSPGNVGLGAISAQVSGTGAHVRPESVHKVSPESAPKSDRNTHFRHAHCSNMSVTTCRVCV